jgi:hypothetical protein
VQVNITPKVGLQLRELDTSGGPTGTASGFLGDEWLGVFPTLENVLRLSGVRDVLTLRCEDPSHRGCTLSVTLPEVSTLSRRQTEGWGRVSAHILAGLRLKRGLPGQSTRGDVDETVEAVLTPAGRVEHATGPAKERAARERLITAGARIHKARGRLRRTDPDQAIALWRALVAGRWSLVDLFDTDGRRYLIARCNPPSVAETRPRLQGLTPRERQMPVGFARHGDLPYSSHGRRYGS